MDKTLPPFGMTSAKAFPPKIGQLKPSKIVKIGHSTCIYLCLQKL